MKKSILIALLIVGSVAASAVVIKVVKKAKSKVTFVSESVDIPYFIDTLMLNEKLKIQEEAKGSNTIDKRLTTLGFSAKTGRSLDSRTTKTLAVLHETYDSIYPHNQFVNFRAVNEIMKKFHLSFGSVSSYIGEIPKDRIDSMESFKISFLFDRPTHYAMHDLIDGMEILASVNDGYGNLSGYIETYDKISDGQGFLGKEKSIVKYALLDIKKRPLDRTEFFILAPPDHFTGIPNESGTYGKIKDPIVLAPVEGGYIIVTAW